MPLLDCLFLGLALNGLRRPWLLAAVSAVLWSLALARPFAWRRVPAWRLWAAWLAWTGLSALASLEPLRAFAAFSRSATCVLFFALACALWGVRERGLWLQLLCACGVLLGLASLLVPSPGFPGVGLLYPYHNYTAFVEATAFSACLGALGASEAPREKAALLLVMALCLALVLGDRSRGGTVACAAAAAFWALRRGPKLAAAALLAGLALFDLAPSGGLARLLKLSQPSANVRPEIWRSALAVAADHPWLGEGPGQFDRGFLRHNFPAPPGSAPTRYGLRSAHAHSELLQAAAETGWPGLALWLAALGASLAAAWPRDPTDAGREAGLLAFVAMSVQALFDNILNLPALGFLYYSALAAAQPWPDGRVATGSAPQRALLACGLALSCVAWWPDWAARDLERRAFSATGEEGVRDLAAALRIAPEDADLWEGLARQYLRLSPPAPLKALAALQQAEDRNPTNALYPILAAEILRTLGWWSAELTLSERALQLEPDAHLAGLQRAEALLRLGRTQEAARQLSGVRRPPERPWVRGYESELLRFDPERLAQLREALLKSASPSRNRSR